MAEVLYKNEVEQGTAFDYDLMDRVLHENFSRIKTDHNCYALENGELKSLPQYVVYFPEIVLDVYKASSTKLPNLSHKLRAVFLNITNPLRPRIFRNVYTSIEKACGYVHSHVQAGQFKINSSGFLPFCMGTGRVTLISPTSLIVGQKPDYDAYLYYILEIIQFISTESRQGSPHFRTENLTLREAVGISDELRLNPYLAEIDRHILTLKDGMKLVPSGALYRVTFDSEYVKSLYLSGKYTDLIFEKKSNGKYYAVTIGFEGEYKNVVKIPRQNKNGILFNGKKLIHNYIIYEDNFKEEEGQIVFDPLFIEMLSHYLVYKIQFSYDYKKRNREYNEGEITWLSRISSGELTPREDKVSLC